MVAGFPVLVEATGFPVVIVNPEPAPPALPAAPELPDDVPEESEAPWEVATGDVLATEFKIGQVVVYKALVEVMTLPIEQPLGGAGQDVTVLNIFVNAVDIVSVGEDDEFPYELCEELK